MLIPTNYKLKPRILAVLNVSLLILAGLCQYFAIRIGPLQPVRTPAMLGLVGGAVVLSWAVIQLLSYWPGVRQRAYAIDLQLLVLIDNGLLLVFPATLTSPNLNDRYGSLGVLLTWSSWLLAYVPRRTLYGGGIHIGLKFINQTEDYQQLNILAARVLVVTGIATVLADLISLTAVCQTLLLGVVVNCVLSLILWHRRR